MIGKTLLHYEIKSQLGKGGMGEVFCARDAKLGRDVAIKILPAALAGDPEREARFQREARALASLQHPNVASVYGFEEADGIRFLVMELVIGEDLSRRMLEGPIPPDEVMRIAGQIADGLEAAHENGIVHRDLKPANIMLTAAGDVKILDFGLAQAWFGDATTGSSSSMVPTITAAMTQAGAILGTAAYMSPEQARGSSVDRRTDIWAFGVILYEMLTGTRLFHGETVSDTLAAVLRAEPDWQALPVAEYPGLCRLITRCLERNPRLRLRDIGEARIFLQDGDAVSGTHLSFSQLDHGATAVTPAAPARSRVPYLIVGILALLIGLGAGWLGWNREAVQEPWPVLHTMIPPPSHMDYDLRGVAPGPAMLSPDGRLLAFTAMDTDGQSRLYLRHLDKGESVALPGTEGACYPFWSPDNRFIGYFDPSGNRLRKIAVAGGPPTTICAAPNGKGGSWNSDGDIIFTPDFNKAIFKVPAIGGEPVPLTRLGTDHDSHRHPRFLPGGRDFIFIGRQSDASQTNDVFLASLDTTITPRVIARSQGHAEYSLGHLLTVREGVLLATPFTTDQPTAAAGSVPLVENILFVPGAAVGVFSASSDGMLTFQTGSSTDAGMMLYWVDIESGNTQVLGEPGMFFHPVISPDGERALLEVSSAGFGTDLWLVDLTTGLRTRFTFAVGDETRPVWSPDGQHVYYSAREEGVFRIIRQPVEGRGGATVVLESRLWIAPTSISPDNTHLLLDWTRDDGKFEMRRLSLASGNDGRDGRDGHGSADEPTIVATAGDNLGGGIYSPDGRWIAYHTESPQGYDVFVIPADGGARKWQVTNDGAVYPRWTHDGTELWVSSFGRIQRAYAIDGSGDTFRVGAFRATVNAGSPDPTGNYYSLHPDGKRLLHTAPDPTFRSEVSYLHLVTDWRRGLVQ
jgi:Tol biopolymer transport system component